MQVVLDDDEVRGVIPRRSISLAMLLRLLAHHTRVVLGGEKERKAAVENIEQARFKKMTETVDAFICTVKLYVTLPLL